LDKYKKEEVTKQYSHTPHITTSVRGQEHISIEIRVQRGFLFYGYKFLPFSQDNKKVSLP
jgi:hypothetical protein